jgi:DUF4097 and DUF4098 domain-containing protein YvlB
MRFHHLALLAAGTASALGAQGTERHSVSGNTVAIYNIAGRVDVVAGGGSDVVVHVTRGGSDASKLKVATGSRGSANDLRVIYPDEDVVYPAIGRWSNSSFYADRDGYFGDRDNGGRWGRDRNKVKGSGSGTEAWADLRVEVPAGKTVIVRLIAGEAVATNIKGRLTLDVGAAKVRARGIDGALSIDAGSGHVSVEDVTGDLDIDTGSGGVDLTNVSGGRLKLDAGSGGVRGGQLKATDLDVDVGSGGVELDRITAEHASFDAGSGSLRLAFLNSPKSLNIDTGSGGATLSFPASLSAEIEVETGSGGVDNDFAVDVRRVDRHYLRGTIGKGEGRIKIETGSGGVRLRKN